MSNLKQPMTFGSSQIQNLNVSRQFREAVSKAIKQSGLSREQVIDMIEALTGLRISRKFFDQTVSSKLQYRFPAEVLHAFCLITGSLEPVKILMQAIGCDVITPEEVKELKLMKLLKEKERIEKEIEKLIKGGEL